MIFYISMLVMGVALATTGVLTFWQPHVWYEWIYRLILLFLGGYFGMMALWLITMGIMTLFIKKVPHTKQSKWAMFWLEQGHDCMLAIAMVRTKINGLKKLHVGEKQKFLLVCNHRSIYDSMVMTSNLKYLKISWITKASNYRVPFFGRFCYAACFYPIVKTDHLQSLESFKYASDLIASGEANVGVFPEGKRQQDDYLIDFHEGVFNIALRAKCPIVIATSDGSDQVHRNWPFKPTTITIDILGVVPYEELEGQTAKAISDRVHTIMKEHLEVIDVMRFERRTRRYKKKHANDMQ